MDTERWIENTGERRVRKPTSVVRRRAGGEGQCKQYLACCLSYFVVLHPDKPAIEQVQQLAQTWLAGMGLTLKPSKTHITHTLHEEEGQVGFDFLGFHIQQFPVGKTHSAKRHDGVLLGFKTIITPSASAVKRHQQALKEVIERHQALPQAVLITHLNPLIRGWATYYASVCAKRCYTQMDTYLFQRLWHWSKRRHPNKSGTWRARMYWHPEKGGWRFATETGSLHLHRMTPIKRHVKVQGRKSPFDGDWVYWTKRQGAHPQTPPKWRTCSRSKAGDVIGVTSISKRETCWKLTIASLAPVAERTGTVISNSCIAIAMIRKQPPIVHRRREVLLTRAKPLRSRMTLTCHVRF